MSLRSLAYDHIPSPILLRGLYWRRRLLHRLERETLLLRPFVRRGSVCVDVGAYDGLYTLAFARWGAKKVHAFEPHPIAAKRLGKGRLPKAVTHAVALSDMDGEASLLVPAGRYGRAEGHLVRGGSPNNTFRKYTVPVRRLDGYGFEDVGFIKIDVEGNELAVLRGGRETISKSRPVLFIEVEERHHNNKIDGVLEEVTSYGYRGQFLGTSKWLPIGEFDPTIHQREGSTHYVNNFLFLPE
jgi:FkbM family methyltransferase